MSGISLNDARWKDIVLLARSGAANTHMRLKDGDDGKVLYANQTKISLNGHKTRIDPYEVEDRRREASNAIREKFRQTFEAENPEATRIVLSKFSSQNFPDGLKKSDVKKMHKLRKVLSQYQEASRGFRQNGVSSNVVKLCSLNFFAATQKKNAKVDEPSLQSSKLIDRGDFDRKTQKVFNSTVSKLCGLALQEPMMGPEDGFRSFHQLRAAMGSGEALEGVTSFARGRDVLLLPQIMDHPELEGVRHLLTLAVIDDAVRTSGDASNDAITLALSRFDPDLGEKVISTEHPGVKREHSVKDAALNAMLDIIAARYPDVDGFEDFRDALRPIQDKVDNAVANAENIVLEQALDEKHKIIAQFLDAVAGPDLEEFGSERLRDVIGDALRAAAGDKGVKYATAAIERTETLKADLRQRLEAGQAKLHEEDRSVTISA